MKPRSSRRRGRAAAGAADATLLLALVDTLPDAVYALDRRWRYTYVNAEAERLLGLRLAHRIGRVIWNEFPGMAATPIGQALRRAAAQRTEIRLVEHYAPQDGWFEVRVRPGAAGVAVHFRDVSEQHRSQRADEETRRLAQRLSSTLESISDGFYIVDRDWRLTHLNANAARIVRRTPEELVGLVLWDVVPTLLGSPFEREYRRALREGVAVTVEAPGGAPGTWFRANAYPSDEGLAVYVRDVTAEHAAREQLLLLEASVSQLQDMVLIAEVVPHGAPAPRTVFVNEALLRNTGYAREELIGRSPEMLYGPLTDRAETERLRAQLGRFEPFTGQNVRYRKNGEPFWVELAIAPVSVRGGGITHFVGVQRDITQRMRDQEALRELNTELEARVLARTAELNRAREAAEQASRAKSDFLATMSHEIRTPMNGVLGMIDVLSQTGLKGHQREMADLIRDSAHSLLAIIDDILDFSKIEAGKMRLETGPMRLAETVEQVRAMLDPMAHKRGVRLVVFVDPAIPQVLSGDPNRVRQVLLNLCSNAIKFSSGGERRGQVSVRAILVPPEEPPQPTGPAPAHEAAPAVVDLIVGDNGIGMDEAALAQLFTPFSQADVSTTRRFGGTGLGLAICGTLVRLMGGEIAVRSTPGEGSIFSVRLRFPCADAAGVPPMPAGAWMPDTPSARESSPPDERLPGPAATPPRDEARRHGRLILIAEDNETNQIVVVQQLQLMGLTADVVADGHEALARWRSGDYALVLTDLHMPGMDGYALAAAIRAAEAPGTRTPIIALTANALRDEELRCLAAGMDAYLTKPIRMQRLRSAIEHWLAPASRPGGSA